MTVVLVVVEGNGMSSYKCVYTAEMDLHSGGSHCLNRPPNQSVGVMPVQQLMDEMIDIFFVDYLKMPFN